MNENKCPYCRPYKYDAYLYAEDIFVITKHLYGKAQQVEWTGKALSNYEAEYDDYNDSACQTDCSQDCEMICTDEEKYFLAVDGEWITYFPISYCPMCGRNLMEEKY